MISRRVTHHLGQRLAASPAVVLLGPRQVGKTTLALDVALEPLPDRGQTVYLDLERPADRAKLDDADAYLRAQSGRLVILDEIHHVPALFSVLRGIIDERRRAGDRAGHFLLLGSASLDLMRQASETLAGRVAVVELDPVDLTEVAETGAHVQRDLWVRGGYPESLLATDDSASLGWRRDFIRSYLERDVPMFAPRLPAATIGRLWTMLAHAQGSLLNQSQLARGLAVSVPAIGRYIDLLADLMLLRRLPPWSGNVGKRLTRSPKIYLRDSGLVHALLGLERWEDVLGHPVAGASWEGFVVENILRVIGDRFQPSFFRTAGGAEADLVLERGGRVAALIEVKLSTAPSVGRGFHEARHVLRPERSILVHGATESWPLADGMEALCLHDALKTLRSA